MKIEKNLKIFIEKYMDNLTISEKKIVEYLLANWDDTPTPYELAKNTNLSNSLVSKTFKKYGFKSSREFYFIKNSTSEELFNYLIDIQKRNYNLTIVKNSLERIINFSKSLNNYDYIFLHGVGHSNIACLNFKIRLRRIGFNVVLIKDRNSIVENASLMQKNSLVILVSESGNNLQVENFAHFCKEKNINLTLFTTDINSNAAKWCEDIYLYHTEKNYFFLEVLGAEEAAIQLFNIIYFYLLNDNYEESIDHFIFSNSFTEFY